ncbi:MAG: diaminopimelate decarboxylase [Defluviitaleaceae bacterium]|nr:diaminopimelate decarboxylase [Defluviitaleaceae bacterium]
MKLNGQVTDATDFYQGHDPHTLVREYGSPLYVYNERIFRKNCRDLIKMCPYHKFVVNYSIKANSNLTLLSIAKSEGLRAEATSSGEIAALLAAGFDPANIFFITNNVSTEEMKYAIDRGILFSADSLSQLDRYGHANPGGKVAVRFNPGVGSGHHENVVTGGSGTKFGINEEYLPQVKAIAEKHNLTIVGINQHIGSYILDISIYMESIQRLLAIAKNFDSLEFIDLGGGFGIPYHKQEGEQPLDLPALGQNLAHFMKQFSEAYGRDLTFMIEPGRYVPAESSVLLGTVHAIKNNDVEKYIGTDLGFTVLMRPVLYDAHHDIEVYREGASASAETEIVRIVGNVCESGDYIAKDRELPAIQEGDVLGVLDAGAYGYSMSSQYNSRLRPAEILIRENGEIAVIRHRDTFEDLLRNMPKVLI